jgi:hypothetical protein
MNMKKLCSLFVAASVLLLVGCEIKYNGVAVQLNNECTYILDEELLASLELSGGVDVVVDTAMAKNKVRVVSNTDDFSKLVVKAEKGRLVISSKRELGNIEYKAYVPACAYSAVAVAGGGDLEWHNCNVDELAVTVSGGADCEIKGKCNTLAVVVSGGADADLDELLAGDVSVVASGGADVSLHAVRTIAVTASGGSDVHIYGTPQISGWSVSGGADVHINK